MATSQGTLVEREGKLYVKTVDTMYSEPVRYTSWWTVIDTSGNAYYATRPKAGDECHGGSTNGPRYTYSVTDPANGRSVGYATTLGSAVAAFREETPIPCPKHRSNTQTRYYCGRWQKFTAKGWRNF